MRAALLVVVALGAPTIARAEVFENRVIPQHQGTTALAPISHTLFLNRCTGNCIVKPTTFMTDDSRTDRSSIPQAQVSLAPFDQGDVKWDMLVECVKQTFIPFNVDVVTVDPGTAAHHEVMVTGSASQALRPGLSAGGVAPFIACGGTYNNGLSFVFGGTTDLEFLCGAVAQEAAHVWGLDHELNKDDPMTYLQLGSLKRFQNADAQCHDANIQPATCRCGGELQNSYQYMLQTFGASNLPPATVAIATPVDGQWVKPGFPIRAQLMSAITGSGGGSLAIDGMQTATATSTAPLAFNAPMMLAGGDHTVTVNATDGGGRSASGSVHVKVTATCSASAPCASNTYCIGGFCVPGNDVDGGLGATCTTNDNCITGQCGTADGESLCTGGCDASGKCPSGYDCLGDGGAGVCWPSTGNGGCSTSERGGSGGPLALLAGLGFAAILARRRR